MKRFTVMTLLVAVMFVALGAAALTVVSITTTPAEAAGCICPQIYAPVICDNGKTYPNQCVADCHHAKNCVPASTI